jgi:hypothetical protein
MIRQNALRHILDPIGQKGNHQPFDIEVIKLSTGQVVTGNCICVSSSFKKDTVKLRFTTSGEIRDFHFSLITKYNGEKVI